MLLLLKERFAICKLGADAALPSWLNYQGYSFVSRSPEELSIICSESITPPSALTEGGWRCVLIKKPSASAVRTVRIDTVTQLAKMGLPSYTVSAYETDYVLFRDSDIERVRTALADLSYDLHVET